MWLDDIILVTTGTELQKKLITKLEEIQEARYRASEKKAEFFLKTITCQGHEKTENGKKPNINRAILQLKLSASSKQLRSFLEVIQYFAKILRKHSRKTDRIRQVIRKKSEWN